MLIAQKWARRRSRFPRIPGSGFGRFQIGIDELPAFHSQSPRQAIYFLVAECGLHLLAAVRAACAIDSRPDSLGQLKDTLIQFGHVQATTLLQEPAESPILILLLLGQHAQLERFDGHRSKDTKLLAVSQAADLGSLGVSRLQLASPTLVTNLPMPFEALMGQVWGIAAGAGTGSHVAMHFGPKQKRNRVISNPNLSDDLRSHEGSLILYY